MVFVIYKNVILSIEYCTQHSVQELSSSLFYSSSGGQFSESVTPGKLFMFIPGRKPVPAIPWMMLLLVRCCVKINQHVCSGERP